MARVLAHLFLVLNAIHAIGESRRRGVRIDWKRTLILTAGSLVVAALACGALIGALLLDQALAGALLFAAIVLAGIVALAIADNRIWPRAAR
jgi:uncharacterized membrane protein YoaK (UPF0700 family)